MARAALGVLTALCRVLRQTVVRTIREEIKESQEAAEVLRQLRAAEEETNRRCEVMPVDEAMMILNVDKLDLSQINERYEFLFKSNDKLSFYLQSKVFRARESLLRELKRQQQTGNTKITDKTRVL